MEIGKYYFVQKKSSKEEYFPCRVIKLHNSWAEVENLETRQVEKLISFYNKTEIDIRFQKIQKLNSFIEEKGVVLHPLVPPLGEDNSSLSLEIFMFLTRKDDIKNLEEKFNNEALCIIKVPKGTNGVYIQNALEKGKRRIQKLYRFRNRRKY